MGLTDAKLGTFPQGQCMELRTISNSTQVNISSISFPNSTTLFFNTPMTQTGKTFNYTFCRTNSLGEYVYDYFDKEGNIFVNNFDVTYNGDVLTESKATLYSVMLGITILFWFLILFYALRMPIKNERDEEGIMKVSGLKYLRHSLMGVLWFFSITILFLASNLSISYLPFQMFGNILFNLYKLMFLLTIPGIILWVLWIFYTGVNDKQIQRYLKMGMDYGGDPV